MAALAGTTSPADSIVLLARLDSVKRTDSPATTRLDRVHAFLAGGALAHVLPLLADAHARAARVSAAGGGNDSSDTLAAQIYASDVVARLAAEGELDPADTQITVGALAETSSIPLATATFDLFQRTISNPILRDLPPVVAAEIQLNLLLHLDVAADVSLWRRTPGGDVECILSLGDARTDRHVRAAARTAITGRAGVKLVGRTTLRAAAVERFGEKTAAIVARVHGDPGRQVRAYLDESASALAPVLERELLLERNATHERALMGNAENRLTRLGFDLHDGPIQDVIALGAEVCQLRDQIYPFVLSSHRERANGRFDDILARLVELDRQLRETAHSLESRSIVSRPLAEILHREVEAFARRTGIAGSAEVRGDPESLSAAQRIAIFRAVQESLSNVREHSGATGVEVRLQVRRATVDVRVTDNGQGFEVSRSLALAAERGRLGLVGIGERVRVLGGSFDVDSRPGGPTTIRFSLPRWEPFQPIAGARG